MKVNEVPQDNLPQYYEGLKKGCYAIDDEGKYVIVPSLGWAVDELINGLAVDELTANLEKTRKAVLAGQKSPLCYHMEVRQMIPDTCWWRKTKRRRRYSPSLRAGCRRYL